MFVSAGCRKRIVSVVVLCMASYAFADVNPVDIVFTRQAARRLVFDSSQDIPLWSLRPQEAVGLDVMHPSFRVGSSAVPVYAIDGELLRISAPASCRGAMWLGGMNPFAGYHLDIDALEGEGCVGFDFASPDGLDRLSVLLTFTDGKPAATVFVVTERGAETHRQTLYSFGDAAPSAPLLFTVQMLGSGLTVFVQTRGLPQTAGQVNEFSSFLDLRRKDAIHTYRTRLLSELSEGGRISVRHAKGVIDTGVGLADMRAMTYRDGRPYLENGRLWYTLSIRGRTLPQHIQGVFSMDPSVFDLTLEGIILFDRGDGLLRNEIASHIFYDEQSNEWRGITTGFTAFADRVERKQLLAVRSAKDPRFGISIMAASPMELVGDYEDAHLVYDVSVNKWRMLLCENHNGYKAVVRESDRWDGGFERISGPVDVDTTGTVIQMIGQSRYCLFGSAARQIFVYSYPDLKRLGQLTLDLPPWSATSGTRVWANLVPLPQGYMSRYVLLTMDRFNYPGITGPNWSYGAVYLYHGHHPKSDDHPYEYARD